MELEILLKMVVPLVLLAIWALTSLLNREARPMPPRMGQGLGPRPGGLPPSPRPLERAVVTPAREPSPRWQPTPGAMSPAARRPPGRPDEEILIIRSETTPSRQASPSPQARPGGSLRKASRGRAAGSPARRIEPTPVKPLATAPGLGLITPVNRPLEVAPLTVSQPALTAEEAASSTGATSANPKVVADRRSIDLRRALGSRDRVREAFVLNELLQPPLALRRPRRI
jgi:hypothetical protein